MGFVLTGNLWYVFLKENFVERVSLELLKIFYAQNNNKSAEKVTVRW
jgi:hypothetical protein